MMMNVICLMGGRGYSPPHHHHSHVPSTASTAFHLSFSSVKVSAALCFPSLSKRNSTFSFPTPLDLASASVSSFTTLVWGFGINRVTNGNYVYLRISVHPSNIFSCNLPVSILRRCCKVSLLYCKVIRVVSDPLTLYLAERDVSAYWCMLRLQ